MEGYVSNGTGFKSRLRVSTEVRVFSSVLKAGLGFQDRVLNEAKLRFKNRVKTRLCLWYKGSKLGLGIRSRFRKQFSGL